MTGAGWCEDWYGFQTFDLAVFDGVCAINPITDQPTPYLQQFVVTQTHAGRIHLWPPTLVPDGAVARPYVPGD